MRARSQFFRKFCTMKHLMPFMVIILAGCVHQGIRKSSESFLQRQIETSYYTNGTQEYEAEFLNGKLDGLSRYWSQDGILLTESEYSNGKPHGIWKKYNDQQNVIYETHYFHGNKHGTEKWYHDNGQLKSEESFKFGKSMNDIIRWYPDGSIIY